MLIDLPVAVPLVVSVLGALGVGSVIGQWFAGGKDRRAARADVLAKLGEVEQARWYEDGPDTDGPRLLAATRALETSALIARVPRTAVLPYAQMATAGLWAMQNDVEVRGDPEWVGLEVGVADVITGAAEIVSRAAWSSPVLRWLWLGHALRANQRQTKALTSRKFTTSLEQARRTVR